MSIIYDALNKTQQARAKRNPSLSASVSSPLVDEFLADLARKQQSESPRPFETKKTSSLLMARRTFRYSQLWAGIGSSLSVIMISFTVVALYHLLSANFGLSASVSAVEKPDAASKAVPAITAAVPANTQLTLVLNGVFLSKNNKMAQINHNLFRLGDQINGMKIVSIELDSVVLQSDNNTIVLQPA